MKITDRFFQKEFVVETSEPYLLSLKIIDRMRDFYGISEKRNEYKTDGPEQMSVVEFIVTKEIDDYTHIKMDFCLNGNDYTLNVKMTGEIVLILDNYGFFSEAFGEFYMEKLYGDAKDECEKAIEKIKKRFERVIDAS